MILEDLNTTDIVQTLVILYLWYKQKQNIDMGLKKEKLTFDEWTQSKNLTFKNSGNFINMHNAFVSINEVRQMYQNYIRS